MSTLHGLETSSLYNGEANASLQHLNKINILLCCSDAWKREENICFFQLPSLILKCL